MLPRLTNRRGLSLSRRSMKRLFLILATLSYSTIGDAQTKSDEDAVRALPRAFCEAWAKHDGHQLATIMAEDVDFITVGGAGFMDTPI